MRRAAASAPFVDGSGSIGLIVKYWASMTVPSLTVLMFEPLTGGGVSLVKCYKMEPKHTSLVSY